MSYLLAKATFPRMNIAFLIFLLLISCSFDPPVAPTWETNITLPLINKTFHMDEIVNDEKYLTSDSTGQVYFDFSREMDRYTVGDKLHIEGFDENFEANVGSFKIEALEPSTVTNPFTSIYSGAEALHGVTMAAPEFLISDVTSTLPTFEEFSWIVIDTGTVFLSLTNGLPVWLGTDLVLKLIDDPTDTLISESSFNREIAPGEIVTTNIDLSDKRFSNQIKLVLVGSSPGSKGELVTVDAYSSIEIVTTFSTFAVKEALAKIPAIRSTSQEALAIDDSVSIETAIIQSGQLNFAVDNLLTIPGKLIYQLSDFYKNGEPYIDSTYLADESHSQFSIPLQGLVLRPKRAEVGEQEIRVEWTFVTESSNSFAHVRSSDQFQAHLSSSEIVFSAITGILKDVTIEIEPFSEDLNFSDELDSVKLVNAIIRLEIENTINFPAHSNITIQGINGAGKTVNLQVQESILPAPDGGSRTTTIILDKTNSDIIEFMNALPEQILVSGSVQLGDDNSPGSVEQSDYIQGSINITAPLSFSFPTQTATSEIDTLEIEEDSQETIHDRLLSGQVVARITNKMPFGATIVAKLSTQDSTVYSRPQLLIGPLDIKPAPVDAAGYASSASLNEITLGLTKEDLQIFENEKVFTGIEIIFPGSDGTAVHVMTSDYITIQLYSVLKINVGGEDSN